MSKIDWQKSRVCLNCVFWRNEADVQGECHRKSPIRLIADIGKENALAFTGYGVTFPKGDRDDNLLCETRSMTMAIWPTTLEHDWCGQHVPKREEQNNGQHFGLAYVDELPV